MIWFALSVLLVVLPAITATIFQLDAWPFDSYPMFSKRLRTEELLFFRIAYEDRDGQLLWWKPHYYKLVEAFGQEAKACLGFTQAARSRRLTLLFTRIEQCITNDPAAKEVVSICLIQRRFARDEKVGWHLVDTFIDRRPTRQSRTHEL